jgi:hypothetical protein
MRQIVRLGNHDIIAVRQNVQQIFEQNVERVRYEAAEALRLLDAKQEDIRVWSFEYFRQKFTHREWTPENLVFVCDSNRPDVQNFGKQMIGMYFTQLEGERYLLQLSQHPSQNLQHFATGYLEQHAAGNPNIILKLEHYFQTILSQVNRSGVAKAKIFKFLETEALQNDSVAEMVAKLMTRQSATLAVADKAAAIKVMLAIRKKYPTLSLPILTKQVVVRG